jgi:MATE family multidrug resistance protein
MDPFYFQEFKRLMRLMFPVLVTQLIMVGMSVVDTLMAGQVSSLDLAGVAVGSSLLNPVVFATQGVLMAVTPIIANHWGANRRDRIGHTFIQSLWLALALGCVAMGAVFMLPGLFDRLDVAPDLRGLASDYLFYVAFGVPACALYQALRGLHEGLANTRIIMLIGLLGIGANVPLNYAFIYGVGVPAFGGAGCGIATAAVFWIMAFGLFGYSLLSRRYLALHLFHGSKRPSFKELVSISKLGLPIAGSIFFEVSLFSAVAALLTQLGPITVAAHQVTLNFASIIFMVPLSIGIAVTIRIGHLLGEGQTQQARKLSFMAITTGAVIALVTSVFTFTFRSSIIGIYTQDPHVTELAMSLFLVAAGFQFSDAIQIISSSALRGYQDTRTVFIITMFCYWPIGLFIGCVLSLTDWLTTKPLGAIGFWYAIVIALTSASLLLGYRLYILSLRLSTT